MPSGKSDGAPRRQHDAAMPELTPKELRRFGLSVGGVFAAMALFSWWRGHVIPPLVLGSLAAFFMVPGLLFPRALRTVQPKWMRGATVLGEINGRIILSVLFFLVIWPIGRVLRLRRDPLDRSLADGETSVWIKREKTPVERERYERQF